MVSTHSRPKAAGYLPSGRLKVPSVSTHSRPKAAGSRMRTSSSCHTVFQLTAARRRLVFIGLASLRSGSVFQLTAARRRLVALPRFQRGGIKFQLTAARRRLVIRGESIRAIAKVSTHSRPKAAGFALGIILGRALCFNSQPPEGGWPGRA